MRKKISTILWEARCCSKIGPQTNIKLHPWPQLSRIFCFLNTKTQLSMLLQQDQSWILKRHNVTLTASVKTHFLLHKGYHSIQICCIFPFLPFQHVFRWSTFCQMSNLNLLIALMIGPLEKLKRICRLYWNQKSNVPFLPQIEDHSSILLVNLFQIKKTLSQRYLHAWNLNSGMVWWL